MLNVDQDAVSLKKFTTSNIRDVDPGGCSNLHLPTR